MRKSCLALICIRRTFARIEDRNRLIDESHRANIGAVRILRLDKRPASISRTYLQQQSKQIASRGTCSRRYRHRRRHLEKTSGFRISTIGSRWEQIKLVISQGIDAFQFHVKTSAQHLLVSLRFVSSKTTVCYLGVVL